MRIIFYAVMILHLGVNTIYSQGTIDSTYKNEICYSVKLPQYYDTLGIVFTSNYKEDVSNNIKYTPSVNEILLAEEIVYKTVSAIFGSLEPRKEFVLKGFRKSYRQYFGEIDSNQQRFILINLITDRVYYEVLQRDYDRKLIAQLTYNYQHFIYVNISKAELSGSSGCLYCACEDLQQDYGRE